MAKYLIDLKEMPISESDMLLQHANDIEHPCTDVFDQTNFAECSMYYLVIDTASPYSKLCRSNCVVFSSCQITERAVPMSCMEFLTKNVL